MKNLYSYVAVVVTLFSYEQLLNRRLSVTWDWLSGLCNIALVLSYEVDQVTRKLQSCCISTNKSVYFSLLICILPSTLPEATSKHLQECEGDRCNDYQESINIRERRRTQNRWGKAGIEDRQKAKEVKRARKKRSG